MVDRFFLFMTFEKNKSDTNRVWYIIFGILFLNFIFEKGPSKLLVSKNVRKQFLVFSNFRCFCFLEDIEKFVISET